MSELRDLTAALQSISNSLTSVEHCLAEVVANGTQERLSLHALRGTLHEWGMLQEERDRAVKQVQAFMGDFSHRQVELHDMVVNLQATVQDGHRALSGRMRALEEPEEVTQP